MSWEVNVNMQDYCTCCYAGIILLSCKIHVVAMEDYCVVKQNYFVIIFDFVAMENFVVMQGLLCCNAG